MSPTGREAVNCNCYTLQLRLLMSLLPSLSPAPPLPRLPPLSPGCPPSSMAALPLPRRPHPSLPQLVELLFHRALLSFSRRCLAYTYSIKNLLHTLTWQGLGLPSTILTSLPSIPALQKAIHPCPCVALLLGTPVNSTCAPPPPSGIVAPSCPSGSPF